MSNRASGPFSPEEATRRIREIAKLGAIQTTRHCRNESMPSRGLTFQALLSVLMNGEVLEDPEYDEIFDQYKYRVEGTTIDEDEATAVTVIIDHRTVLVVTIF